MQFTVLEKRVAPLKNPGAYLIKDNWNDYGFVVNFVLQVRLPSGALERIGEVRIADVDMRSEKGLYRTSDRMPPSFSALPESYFSLAHDVDYYAALRGLPDGMADEILSALRDVAYVPGLRNVVTDLDVFKNALMRGTEVKDLDRMERVARGQRARVVPFCWTYTPPSEGLLSPHTFEFRAEPGSLPPTNLHALIGRNGVGKSYLLHQLVEHVTAGQVHVDGDDPDDSLSSCVVVSFSPFDKPYRSEARAALRLSYIGLRHQSELRLKTDDELKDEFVKSFGIARIGPRGVRWRKAIKVLNYPASGFLDGHEDLIERMTSEGGSQRFERDMGEFFESLSSGHRATLLTVTRLVELVTERTLVLIDEPETHLHPPLLAALMRSVSDLLSDRNGMAILATHSPVVLQEVPASCVWKMIRNGKELTAHRPRLETYGENVGELTHEAFGLEVTATGYHAAIAELVARDFSYEDIMGQYSSLGSEARSLLRAMTYTRPRQP